MYWRIIEGIVSLPLLWVGFLVYQDDQGRAKDALTVAWIHIHDSHTDPSIVRRFVQQAARQSLRTTERIFGGRYWSFRFFVPAALLGAACYLFVVHRFIQEQVPSNAVTMGPSLSFYVFLCAVLGFLPAIIEERWAVFPGAIWIAFFVLRTASGFFDARVSGTGSLLLAIVSMFVVSSALDYLWIIGNQQFMRFASTSRSLNVIFIGLLVSAAVVVFSVSPILVNPNLYFNPRIVLPIMEGLKSYPVLGMVIANILGGVLYSRLLLGLMSSLLFLMMLLLFLHWIFAKKFGEAIYMLEENIVKKREWFLRVGLFLAIDAATQSAWMSWLKDLFKIFA